MPYYEHTFIARPDLTPQQAQGLAEDFSKWIEERGGRVARVEYWGLRQLAYRIKKHRKGHYVFMVLDVPKDLVAELEHRERFSEDILRHLTVKVKELPEGPSPILAGRGRDDRRR